MIAGRQVSDLSCVRCPSRIPVERKNRARQVPERNLIEHRRGQSGRVDLENAVRRKEFVEPGAKMAAGLHRDRLRRPDFEAVHLEEHGVCTLLPARRDDYDHATDLKRSRKTEIDAPPTIDTATPDDTAICQRKDAGRDRETIGKRIAAEAVEFRLECPTNSHSMRVRRKVAIDEVSEQQAIGARSQERPKKSSRIAPAPTPGIVTRISKDRWRSGAVRSGPRD